VEKRVIIAAALSILILVAWGWLFPPQKKQQPVPADSVVADRGPAGATGPTSPIAEPAQPAPSPGVAEPQDVEQTESVQGGAVEEIRIENDLFLVTLTNDGGRVVSWKLLDYTTNGGEPLELLPQHTDATPQLLAVDLDDAGLTGVLNSALYAVERRSAGSAEQILFSWSDGRGLEAIKKLTFHNDTYLVEAELDVYDRGRRLPARLVIGPGFGAQEEADTRSNYYYASQAAWNHAGSVTRMKSKKLIEPGRVAGDLLWVGMEDQYFAVLVVPSEGPTDVTWRSIEVTPVQIGDEVPEPLSEPLLAVAVPDGGARIYVGPKKFTLLRELGGGLDRVVWFASNPFLAWIARFIFLCLIWIHDNTIANYGLAIILATFMLRLLLFPVNQYSMVSMKKTQLQMQRLQPKIKRIKEKYKKQKDAESRQKMNQETMELYRKEGVNPMGGLNGCLPLLAQFPILIGFYNMLTVAVELRGAPFFGWIHDLSQKDPYFVTPLLMGATMFLQQRMAMSKVKDPVQAQQQRFMMIMPVVFTWICIQMPAGMVLYWFVNNLLGMGQQWLVNRHTSRLEATKQKA